MWLSFFGPPCILNEYEWWNEELCVVCIKVMMCTQKWGECWRDCIHDDPPLTFFEPKITRLREISEEYQVICSSGFCGIRITFFMLCCQTVDPNLVINFDHGVNDRGFAPKLSCLTASNFLIKQLYEKWYYQHHYFLSSYC